MSPNPRRRVRLTTIAGALSLALLAGACGGGDDSSKGSSGSGSSGAGGESAAGTPVPGGELSYGLEAETTAGWCLPETQLAQSGIMVARAIYDTLTVPNDKGEYVPFLAESVTPNADNTVWTIKLRNGVKFHDGSALNATVVKNNLDAIRGEYPARKPLLLRFVYSNIASVDVVDDSTLTVTTKTPWPALPAFLYYSGRVGIMAQAQLDDPGTCDTKLIGTGPFKLDEWVQNDHLTASKNPDYWGKDAKGNQLPYLDKVTFKPIADGDSRINSLLSGQLNAAQSAGAGPIETMQAAQKSGEIDLVESSDRAEVAYGMFNTSKPPFDNPIAREAAAYALDRDEFNKVVNRGLFKVATGPFAPGEVGYLDDAGFPKHDPAKAKELLAQYQAQTGKPLEFTFTLPNDPASLQLGQLVQEQGKKVGVKVNLQPVEQATLISTAIGGNYEAIAFRNHPGGDPDTQYVWWYGGAPTNFGKFNDPQMNALLDQGRAETDPAKRKAIYEDVNRLFAKQVYNLWLNWTQWDVGTATDVQGIMGPALPDGSPPSPGLAAGHSLAGAWIQK